MYTIDYFIDKFEKIPEENWVTGRYFNEDGTKFDALGHCGLIDSWQWSEEAIALSEIFEGNVVSVSDNHNQRYSQPTQKQRILAFLYDKKRGFANKKLPGLGIKNFLKWVIVKIKSYAKKNALWECGKSSRLIWNQKNSSGS